MRHTSEHNSANLPAAAQLHRLWHKGFLSVGALRASAREAEGLGFRLLQEPPFEASGCFWSACEHQFDTCQAAGDTRTIRSL